MVEQDIEHMAGLLATAVPAAAKTYRAFLDTLATLDANDDLGEIVSNAKLREPMLATAGMLAYYARGYAILTSKESDSREGGELVREMARRIVESIVIGLNIVDNPSGRRAMMTPGELDTVMAEPTIRSWLDMYSARPRP